MTRFISFDSVARTLAARRTVSARMPTDADRTEPTDRRHRVASNSFLSSLLLTFPIAFRGISSTTTSALGHLYDASVFFVHARSDSAVTFASSPPPPPPRPRSVSATTAPTLSPYVSSATPHTAHSTISSCVRRMDSTSSALTLYPPVLMTSKPFRPNTLYAEYTTSDGTSYSRVISTTSPVLKYPSSSNASAVFSGRPRYSTKTPGDFTRSSPYSPSAPGMPL
eukprot:30488-Pelagococcus_subviridis.AAC.1